MEDSNNKDFKLFLHLDPEETTLEEIEHTPTDFIDGEVSKEEGSELLQALQKFDKEIGRK